MTNSGLYPIQTWLWSVLDDLGIDGVIYSRHILDLLISSKHSFDFRLDEKEQNIFSKIAPSTTKKKRRYSRRSSSFSSCEEVMWKKEIAVSCLLSAAETKSDSQETEAAIQQLVDELYNKLSRLNLASDGKSASSDGDCPSFVGNRSSLLKKKKHNKENYEDAFPSLAGSQDCPTLKNPFADSVWSKVEKRENKRSGRDSDNVNTKKPTSSRGTLTKDKSQHYQNKNESMVRRSRAKPDQRNTARKAPKRSPFNIQSHYHRMYFEPKEVQQTSGASNTDKKPVNSVVPKQPPKQNRARQQLKFDNIGSPQKYRGRWNKGKKKHKGYKVQKKTTANTQKKSTQKTPAVDDYYESHGNGCTNDFHLHYAHLPSWMETTLIDMSQKSCTFGKCKAGGGEQSSDEESIYGDEFPSGMPFSKRWYRDSATGLLTFRPLKVVTDKEDSSDNSLSRTSSFCEDGDQEVVFHQKGEDSKVATAPEEPWMWCPSPSLWEDGTQSPVSRLESVYKKELLSLNTENGPDSLSGRMWENYRPIFQELNEMLSTNEEGVRGDRVSSVWPQWEELDGIEPPMSATLSENPLHKRFESEYSDAGNEFGLWKKSDPDRLVTENIGFESKAVGSSFGNSAPTHSALYERSVWKFSPKTSVWPVKKEIRKDSLHRDELSEIMQRGAFGIQRHHQGDCWSSSQKDEFTLWGGGVVPDDPCVSEINEDEKTMNSLVDAMFGDFCFDLFTAVSSPHVSNATETSPSPFDMDFRPMTFGIESFLLGNQIKHLYSENNDPWQPKWDMDDLSSKSSTHGYPSFTNIDDVLRSIVQEESMCQSQGMKTPRKIQTILDSVTENPAWKTSLRIGNSWQNISGIRPVNVIYSENSVGSQTDDTLVPSSKTHFRPISRSIGNNTPDYDATLNMEYPDATCTLSENENMESELTAIQNRTTVKEPVNPKALEDLTVPKKFYKSGEDKSMQTSLEMVVQQNMPISHQFVLARPPKANSR